MVLAAGLGTRMRPITDQMPKPLVKVHGRTLLDHGLDALAAAGVKKAVVNVHHLADQIEAHVAGRMEPKVIVSDERARLLDSGGGVRKALPALGTGPAFLLNADSFWLEGAQPNLQAMAQRWDDDAMDMLLLVSCTIKAVGYQGQGDFDMDSEGRLKRRGERRIAAFAYCGAAIFHPRLFDGAPDGPFSLNLLFDRAIEAGRLFGMRMDGLWLHVGTPEAIQEAERAIALSAA
ncbi:MAG: nucleotidyltransferase family protein [Nitratireductor sp.]|nr:nucleotidyltransferase family protein [Nitratireductor sp.]